MQHDVIETLSDSIIQHGSYNDRIYLMKLAPADARLLPGALKTLADQHGYSKIFAKTPAGCAHVFLEEGYRCEASIPGFFNGREEVQMLSLFLTDERAISRTAERNEEVMMACQLRRPLAVPPRPVRSEFRICTPADAEMVATLYSQVFPTYPFPIHDPAYIRQTMDEHVVYFGVWIDGDLAALSSSEMDRDAQNVEMTDFATLPHFRGRGLDAILLKDMEAEMCHRNIATAYTIARAGSFGMNITFARMGYTFGGRLVNNTNIGGQIEDMNVWYKPIARTA